LAFNRNKNLPLVSGRFFGNLNLKILAFLSFLVSFQSKY
jgi:hypothetical protein